MPKGVYWSPIIYSHLQIKSRHFWRRSGDLQGGPDPLANGIIAGAAVGLIRCTFPCAITLMHVWRKHESQHARWHHHRNR